MKRIIIATICLLGLVCGATAEAQVGSLLRKAAKKAIDKTTEKVVDKATDKAVDEASKAIDKAFDGKKSDDDAERAATAATADDEVTYASLLTQQPALPTAQQLVSYKEAELNEQSLKLMMGPVATFKMNVSTLSMQASALAMSGIDTSQLEEMAYRNAELSTGLSRAELEALQGMSDEEQEAYLMAHYRQGTHEEAALKQAEDMNKYLEPLQPMIDQWNAAGDEANQYIDDATKRCQEIYVKYADRLALATGKARIKLLIAYYTETVPLQREAVEQAQRVRLKKQLPIAEQLEAKMAVIRVEHQDIVSSLLNYPQMTASQFFGDTSFLFELIETIETNE